MALRVVEVSIQVVASTLKYINMENTTQETQQAIIPFAAPELTQAAMENLQELVDLQGSLQRKVQLAKLKFESVVNRAPDGYYKVKPGALLGEGDILLDIKAGGWVPIPPEWHSEYLVGDGWSGHVIAHPFFLKA